MRDEKDFDGDYGPPEYGVRSSDIGSFLPEGTYRAVPIVWFAAAWFLQSIVLLTVFFVLLEKHPVFTVLAAGLISYGIGVWTFRRGMAQAGRGWQIFTAIALAFNWVVVSAGIFAVQMTAAPVAEPERAPYPVYGSSGGPIQE